MIITLSGTVREKTDRYAVIEVGGVGYQVFLNAPGLAALPSGKEVRLWTHEYLREDARELYGFRTREEHALFKKLLDISGVGPKTASNILALGPVKDIEQCIERGDVGWLCRIPGVGKKTAQKIILELKGKLVSDSAIESGEEVLSALVKLGYDREAARSALSLIVDTETTVEGRLRAALKQLGSKALQKSRA